MWKKTLLLIALLLAVCPVHAAERVTVMLDWFLNPDHAPLAVAGQIGAFREEGLDVEIIAPADPNLPLRLVAAGQVDLAIGYPAQLFQGVDQGLPLVRIGTLIASPLNTVLTLRRNGITTMADFRGRKIGYSVSGMEDVTLATMLKSEGLTLGDVTLVNVNFQLVSALLSGQVDGVIGGFRNVEANELKAQGADPVMFKVEEHGVPAYDELILIANRARAGDPRFPRFLAALNKATAWLRAHPEASWAAFAAAHPDLDTPLNRTVWMQTLPLFAPDPARLDGPRYEAYGHYLLDTGMIGALRPLGDYARAGPVIRAGMRCRPASCGSIPPVTGRPIPGLRKCLP